MLRAIQVVALVQGIFLLFVLFKNRKRYKPVSLYLFIGSIISILLYVIGDDDNNLFQENTDWFLLDSSLFITFLFLFHRYFVSKRDNFRWQDLLFFTPNVLYMLIEGYEIRTGDEAGFLEFPELLVEFTFLTYLLIIIAEVFKTNKKHWLIYFTAPIAMLMSLSYLNEVLSLLDFEEFPLLEDAYFSSYLLLVVGFLFYYITFKLSIDPNNIFPMAKRIKYNNSSLKPALVDGYIDKLLFAMEEEKLYLNSRLSIHKLAQEIKIPRQYISEILNIHLEKNFQDFVNAYRIEEFTKRLQSDQYEHYTLFAIANEVGFNSKSSFNAIFKKMKGLTPSEYKKSLLKKVVIRA